MADSWVILLHLAATLFMVGLIWFVQIVHYPLLRQVGAAGFRAYADRHQTLTSYVVAPPMLVELTTAIGLLLWPPAGASPLTLWSGCGLLLAIWSSTLFLQMPCHARLSEGFELETIRRLVRTNWIRTAAWSGRAVVAIELLRSGT